MKLLILTQKVDSEDAVLGFFHRWIEEFARHAELVIVICLEKGTYNLPNNVRVYSLGKEEGISKLKYLVRFFSYIYSLRNEYDHVFVHMNQIYIVLGGIWWRIMNKKVALWYTHRQVSVSLRIAKLFSNIIFTASAKSFLLKSKKVHVVGHGIDTDAYICTPYKTHGGPVVLLHVGRITPIKHCEAAIQALAIMRQTTHREYQLRFVGSPHTEQDKKYFEDIQHIAQTSGVSEYVEFMGSMPNREISKEYQRADATLNLTPTGGIDKVVLESMACGRIAFSSNQAFADYFGPFTDTLLLTDNRPETIATQVTTMFTSTYIEEAAEFLKQTVKEKSSITRLIPTIINELNSLRI